MALSGPARPRAVPPTFAGTEHLELQQLGAPADGDDERETPTITAWRWPCSEAILLELDAAGWVLRWPDGFRPVAGPVAARSVP